MQDIAIFLAGILVKSAVGYFVGAGIRRGERVATPVLKKALINERAELIRQHIFMEHKQPLKYCGLDQCVSL